MGILTYKGATAEEATAANEETINAVMEANNCPTA